MGVPPLRVEITTLRISLSLASRPRPRTVNRSPALDVARPKLPLSAPGLASSVVQRQIYSGFRDRVGTELGTARTIGPGLIASARDSDQSGIASGGIDDLPKTFSSAPMRGSAAPPGARGPRDRSTHASVIQRILRHLGLSPTCPSRRPARAPPRVPGWIKESWQYAEFDASW